MYLCTTSIEDIVNRVSVLLRSIKISCSAGENMNIILVPSIVHNGLCTGSIRVIGISVLDKSGCMELMYLIGSSRVYGVFVLDPPCC